MFAGCAGICLQAVLAYMDVGRLYMWWQVSHPALLLLLPLCSLQVVEAGYFLAQQLVTAQPTHFFTDNTAAAAAAAAATAAAVPTAGGLRQVTCLQSS
jgi:hypothetical protein